LELEALDGRLHGVEDRNVVREHQQLPAPLGVRVEGSGFRGEGVGGRG